MGIQRATLKIGNDSFEHFYLCHYRPKKLGEQDRLSKSLLRFKDGLDPDVKAWIDCSVSEVGKLFRNSGAAVLRALDHDETSADKNHPLSELCERFERDVGLKNLCVALSKRRINNKLSLLSKQDRVKETKDNYHARGALLTSQRMLIIDDILTTGATMSAIIDSVREATSSAKIKLFTFARCDYTAELNKSLTFSGRHYLWGERAGWSVNEGRVTYSDNYEQLKERILTDSF